MRFNMTTRLMIFLTLTALLVKTTYAAGPPSAAGWLDRRLRDCQRHSHSLLAHRR